MLGFIIPIVLFVIVLIAAFGRDTYGRALFPLAAGIIAIALSWFLQDMPKPLEPAFATMLGKHVLALLVGVIIGRIAWSIKSGDPILS